MTEDQAIRLRELARWCLLVSEGMNRDEPLVRAMRHLAEQVLDVLTEKP